MKISVAVKAGKKDQRISKVSDREFILWVKAPAKQGRANKAVVEVLSGYFGVAKSRCRITRGHKSRNKVIEII